MRYPASEKLEIIRLVERSPPVGQAPRWTSSAFRAPPSIAGMTASWSGGIDALEDRKPQPKRVWNRIPHDVAGPDR